MGIVVDIDESRRFKTGQKLTEEQLNSLIHKRDKMKRKILYVIAMVIVITVIALGLAGVI